MYILAHILTDTVSRLFFIFIGTVEVGKKVQGEDKKKRTG